VGKIICICHIYAIIIFLYIEHGYVMTAVAILHKDEILKRVAKGDKIADIGKTYGVSHAVISKERNSGVHLVLVLPRCRSRGTL
jgi:hypothetical protein